MAQLLYQYPNDEKQEPRDIRQDTATNMLTCFSYTVYLADFKKTTKERLHLYNSQGTLPAHVHLNCQAGYILIYWLILETLDHY